MTVYSGDKSFYDFLEVEWSEKDNYTNVFDDLRNREFDGIVFRNVITKDQAKELGQAFLDYEGPARLEHGGGNTIPWPFANVNEENVNDFCGYTKEYENYLDRELSFPLRTALQEGFESINQGKIIKAPYFIGDPNLRSPNASLREFSANRGGLLPHCGNLFIKDQNAFYQLTDSMVNPNNQLSFFIVMQQPEQGGELTIYDLEYKDAHLHAFTTGDDGRLQVEIFDSERKPFDIEKKKKFYVNPEPGDMIIFSAGEIWHRVEAPTGNLPRLTYGGFIGYGHKEDDLDTFYVWS